MSASPRTIGKLAQLACEWEVLARKVGNVCPGREFPDLTLDDFLKSAAAIAPVMDEAPRQPLGLTILRAIEATRRVVNTNTNLGIVLLLAPLASVPLDEPLRPGLSRALEQTTVEDARRVYQAIRLAKPGGLGKADSQDVANEPTLPLRDVMGLASEHDLVAWQYVCDFSLVLKTGSSLAASAQKHGSIERAICEIQLGSLLSFVDSLVCRKLGRDAAVELTRASERCDLDSAEGRLAYLEFDAFLRGDNHLRNPGTTADLIAAGLFVALREKQISPDAPFIWIDHPFGA